MSERFAWVPDLERGEWLRPMEAEPPGSILSVVPRGFEAYARVFHPVDRDRPRQTRTWQGLDETTYSEGVDDIEASLETERTTWTQAAESFGTTMHAQAQYARLVRRDYGEVDGAIAADGRRSLSRIPRGPPARPGSTTSCGRTRPASCGRTATPGCSPRRSTSTRRS